MGVTEDDVIVREVRTWHSVLMETDGHASVTEGLDLICMLVNFVKPKVLVEAGTYRGHMALAIANILQMQGGGMLYTADPINTGFGKALGDELKILQPWITFFPGDYLQMLRTVPEPIDFAYIDASDIDDAHLRWTHAQATWVRLRPGGLMLIDDTESKDWPDAKLFQAWAKTDGIHLTNFRGLTILQRGQ